MSGLFSDNESELLSSISARSPLITASFRQANDWKRRYLQHAKKTVVPTPPVYSWNEWLEQLTSQLSSLPVSLNALQEMLVWEKVIRNDLRSYENLHHISYRGLAKRAAQAYSLMQEYRIGSHELENRGEESEALLRWIVTAEKELSSHSSPRCLKADVPALLLTRIQDVSLPESLMLTGFSSPVPMQKLLLESFANHGCNLRFEEQQQVLAEPVLTPCADKRREMENLANRVARLLEQDPVQRIAILTNESSADTTAMARELDRALLPESKSNPYLEIQAISMQHKTLADWPLVRHAMQILSLAGEKHPPYAEFSLLLFSPWIDGFEQERFERARFDVELRRRNYRHIDMLRLLKPGELESMPALRSLIAALTSWDTKSRKAGEWVRSVQTLLQSTGLVVAGMEHHAERSEFEVRCMNRFRDLLATLATADAVEGAMPWNRFLSLLNSACTETQLSLSPRFPNISVLPLSEIEGLCFDRVFVVGMDEQSFPSPARPHPLLPLPLQRAHALPGSTGALQFDAAERIWQRLLRAAPHIEISYAASSDEQELLPSPFVRQLQHLNAWQQNEPVPPAEEVPFVDTLPVPLQDGEAVRGGTLIIKDQSDCPFRAFVRHRLNIDKLGETAPGIEPTTKGSLIHHALEFIWQRLKSQKAMLDLDEGGARELVDESVAHAWRKVSGKNEDGTDINPTRRFEQQRMRSILLRWLEIERQRPPFRVEATERRFDISLPRNGERRVSLRITADRIDRDSEGRSILIDYKTGRKQSSGMWLGERMEQPQLPLYAVAAGLGENSAVTYATVRSGNEMGFEGLAAEETGIEGITVCDGKRGRPDSWPQLLETWQERINALADEFVGGRNDVAPRDAKACTYCSFEAICRIEETGFAIDSEEES